MRGIVAVVLTVFSVLLSTDFAAAQPPLLTAEDKKQTIDRLSELLPERYAYRELGPQLQHVLQQNLKSGKYDRIVSASEFSAVVTSDLRSLNSDRHLALNYSPLTETPKVGAPPAAPLTPEQRAKQASAFNRQMNYGFRKVEFLNGNIGFLRFDYFDAYLDYSGPVVDASMAFLQNSDALIIDLRENGGGASQMVGYIAGFFFKERTLSGTSYDRLTDTKTEGFITPQPKEKQFREIDLYILTSKRTVSAAEGLAYDLKFLRGAKIVGETSAGAANPGRVTRLNNLFTAFIPNRYGASVITGRNWEGTGVPVDIPCDADDALRIARLEALGKLQQKAATESQRRRFASYIKFLERTNPENALSLRALIPYAGEYEGGRSIILKNGRLYYSRVAETGGPLHFIDRDVFMLAEGDVTFTFKRDTRKKVVGLETQWSLSEAPSTARKVR